MTSRSAPRRILFLAVSPTQPLDLFGPLEVFRAANLVRGRTVYDIELVSWRGRTLASEPGIDILAHRTAPRRPPRVDTLVAVGGHGAHSTNDAQLSRWLRAASQHARRVASICTGAFLLGRAGLLDGRTATTHWMFADDFARDFPKVRVERNRLWVEDGKLFTSAGVTSGIDLALALVAGDWGPRVALDIARALVVFLQRSGGQAQFSPALRAQQSTLPRLRDLQTFVMDHLQERHTVDSLASRVGMSPRHFTRLFIRDAGCSPAQFVLALRIDAAREKLENGDDGLDAIAAKTGFTSADVLTRAFRRQLGTTPGAYRDRFSMPRVRARL